MTEDTWQTRFPFADEFAGWGAGRRDWTASTIRQYRAALTAAAGWLAVECGVELDQAEPEDLAAWVAAGQDRGRALPALVGYFDFLAATGRRAGHPAAALKRVTLDERRVEQRATRWRQRSPSIVEIRDGLYAAGLSPETVRNYMSMIVRADTWLRGQGLTLYDAPASSVAEFADTQLPYSWSMRSQARLAFAWYWRVTARQDPPAPETIRMPRRPRMVCRALAPEDARTLARAADEWSTGPEGLAVLVGLFTGARRFEIAKLRWLDFAFREGWVRIQGKGGVVREVPVHPRLERKLSWWRRFDPPPRTWRGRRAGTLPGEVYLFPSQGGPDQPVAPFTVNTWLYRVADAAGVKATVHQLRHTALTEGNEATKDLRSVQEFAGHADPAVTAGYTRATEQGLLRVSDALTSLLDDVDGDGDLDGDGGER